MTTKDINTVPKAILGAAWGPQMERLESGIYFPLFVVLVDSNKKYSIFYLPADVQQRSMFRDRAPLSLTAKRAGWQGFVYDLSNAQDRLVRLK